MVQDSPPAGSPASRSLRHGGRSRAPLTAALVAVLGLGTLGSLSFSNHGTRGGFAGSRQAKASPAPVQEAVAAAAPEGEGPMPDPVPSLGPEAFRHWRSALLESAPQWSPEQPAAGSEPSTPLTLQEPAAPGESPPAQETARLAQTVVPLPVPRPPKFRGPKSLDASRRAERQAARRARSAALPAPAEDDRSFFEKLFGVQRSPALAYAALGSTAIDPTPRQRLSPVPNPDSGGAAAVYDISARTVTLPNGERLEVHSGLGDSMDDPRQVHLRMRGATPPGTYDLMEREQLFHGVRALRLTPVGGSAAVYGRAGLLAHTYMLGPNGASNGCVSFRDYDRFLQAYLRGEVQRLVVVPGRGQDGPPVIATKAPAQPARSARLGSDA